MPTVSVKTKKSYNAWDRPLNDMELRLLYVIFKEVAHLCDYASAYLKERKPYRYNEPPLA